VIAPSSLEFDPNNPQDFLFKANARKAMGGKLSEQDIYNYQVALNAQQKQTAQDPYADYIAKQQAELEATQADQKTAREKAMEAKKAELEAKYSNLKTQAQEAGTREAQA
jgi:hypothetical protein